MEERLTLKSISDSSLAAVLYMLTLSALCQLTNRYTTIVLVVASALARKFILALIISRTRNE